MPSEKKQCKGCKKPFTLLMAHLKKIEGCQKAYGDEYTIMLQSANDRHKCQKSTWEANNPQERSQGKQELRHTDVAKCNEKQRVYRMVKKLDKPSKPFSERFRAFKRDIIHGPNFTCFSCKRCQFKNSVKILGMGIQGMGFK